MHKQSTMQSEEAPRKDKLDFLPGKNTRKTLKAQMLRVDHAGEFGAIHIYRGQETVFQYVRSKQDVLNKISDMKQQEQVHLNRFNEVLNERKVRPSLLSPFWKYGGFLMGAVSAVISDKAAMACTEAVETVIDDHYASQIAYFSDDNDLLLEDLKKFQLDELAHKYEAQQSNSAQAPFYRLGTSCIDTLCKAVIKIAHKI